ncbi:mRNA decay activator protein ZFP36L2-like [Salvelinus fontinalis]|uniref:mRNA decay activator protein ZFP36L2-like n=1 Tax=Salvelinus fontinalis TaxID=8038 RepID=UPI0024855CDF|nr:mRNA decay activator protein ZFP36L2-like [Salvelinus fontinalis]
MPSDFLTPFLELEDEFCKNFRGLDMPDGAPATTQMQRIVGFQRRHSLCPVTLPNSKFNSSIVDPIGEPAYWALTNTANQQWSLKHQQQLPRSSLNNIPFRVDRSISMIEGHVGSFGSSEQQLPPTPPLMPPPGLSISTCSLSSPKSLAPSPPISTRYKTEMCRTYEESGTCKYGAKCQFAHGMDEQRGLSRHPKYKTEPCRTFHTIGFCPYGARCHFIHNADEQLGPDGGTPPQRLKIRERPQLLRHSISFAGFSSPQALTGFHPDPEPMLFSRASLVSSPPSTGSPELLSPLFPEPATLKHNYPFSSDCENDQINNNPHFYTITDSKCQTVCAQKSAAQNSQRNAFSFTGLPALQRCASPDSLSDQEGYTSSSSLSGCESPGLEGRRLPIFSRLSVSDD